jgi:hypothetical protein
MFFFFPSLSHFLPPLTFAVVASSARAVLFAFLHADTEVRVLDTSNRFALQILEGRSRQLDLVNRYDGGHRHGFDVGCHVAGAVEAENEASVGAVVGGREELALEELAGLLFLICFNKNRGRGGGGGGGGVRLKKKGHPFLSLFFFLASSRSTYLVRRVGAAARPVVCANVIPGHIAVLVRRTFGSLSAELGASVTVGNVGEFFEKVGLAVAAPLDLRFC